MSELRWILLTLGVLFIAGLAWWELRRPRQATREGTEHREPSLVLPQMRAREPLRELPVMDMGASAGPVAVPVEASAVLLPPPPQPVAPVVEWPPEEARRILQLRIQAPGERFAGRALRQALSAEGFVHGRLSIYHKSGPDSRAILSAASLTQPGGFELETMDTQRFGGLNLFAVLPGPLPAAAAFEELLASARNLNERLQGTLLDEHGAPLTPDLIAAAREQLAAAAAEHADPPL
jgi:FtsZ-interacting cell division protein ZipA